MEKATEDLSAPYESWASARLDVEGKGAKRRVVPGAFAMLVVVLAIGWLNAWVLVSDVLRPLWSKPSATVLLGMAISFFVGAAVLCLTSKFGRLRTHAMLVGFCLVLPLGALIFAPLFLYINQVGDSSDATCARYTLLKKTVVKVKGYAYELTLSNDAAQEKRLRVHRKLYDELHEGRPLWVQVGNGLFGVRFARQISDMELPDCGNHE
jgi:hypothetical protein